MTARGNSQVAELGAIVIYGKMSIVLKQYLFFFNYLISNSIGSSNISDISIGGRIILANGVFNVFVNIIPLNAP